MLDNKLPGRKPFVHCDGDHDLQVRRNLTQVSREAVDSDASSAARVAVSYQLMFTRPSSGNAPCCLAESSIARIDLSPVLRSPTFYNPASDVRLFKVTVLMPVSKIPLIPNPLLDIVLFRMIVPTGSPCGEPCEEFIIPYPPLEAIILFSIRTLLLGLFPQPTPILIPVWPFS